MLARMQLSRKPLVSNHRLARYLAWTGALLAWFARGQPARTRADARHQRRYGHLGIAALTRFVRNVIILRAIQLLCPYASVSARRRIERPAATPFGCKLGRSPRRRLRPFAGGWLRRQLKVRGNFAQRVAHLISALRHYRGLAAYLAWKRRRFVWKCAIILVWSAPARIGGVLTPAPLAADSS